MSTSTRPAVGTDTPAFVLLETLARLSVTEINLARLLDTALPVLLDRLPLAGVVVWLRDPERDMLAPSASRLPPGYSSSALPEDAPLLQRTVAAGPLRRPPHAAQPLLLLPADRVLAAAPIQNGGMLLGVLGCVGEPDQIEPLLPLVGVCADMLSGPVVNTLLRRQQAEAEDVTSTIFQFAGELRSQQSLEAILGTLNNLALRVFNCDWSAVYIWEGEQTSGEFRPVQIMTRVGEQSLAEEPVLQVNTNPLLELTFNTPQIVSLPDLGQQPAALPAYNERHALRGLVLVPIQQAASQPMGLLVLGYRTPLTTFSSRANALAQGVARIVAVALERTRLRQQEQ